MEKKEYKLLCMFLSRQILTGVDRALFRAVSSLFKENQMLYEKVIELGGEQLKKEFMYKYENEEAREVRSMSEYRRFNHMGVLVKEPGK